MYPPGCDRVNLSTKIWEAAPIPPSGLDGPVIKYGPTMRFQKRLELRLSVQIANKALYWKFVMNNFPG